MNVQIYNDKYVQEWWRWLAPEGRLFAITEAMDEAMCARPYPEIAVPEELTVNWLSVSQPTTPAQQCAVYLFSDLPATAQTERIEFAYAQWFQRQQVAYHRAAGDL